MQYRGITPNPKYFALHGGEVIGAKAGYLILNTDRILDTGFKLVEKRHVLDWNIVDAFLRRSGAQDAARDGDFESARRLALQGKHDSSEERLFLRISNGNRPGKPLKVRSSFMGKDSGGNGAGTSADCLNSPDSVARGFRQAAAGYFNEKAELLRERGAFGEGMGIMVEPMVYDIGGLNGSMNYNRIYAPIISFYGLTTESGICRTVVSKGLGNAAMTDPSYGWMISSQKSLHDAIWTRIHSEERGRSFKEEAAYLSMDGKPSMGPIWFGDWEFVNDLKDWFGNGPEKMLNTAGKKLYATLGRREYFEGSLIRGTGGGPVIYIHQLADAQPTYRFDMPAEAEEIKEVHSALTGAGRDPYFYLWRREIVENRLKVVPLPGEMAGKLSIGTDDLALVEGAKDLKEKRLYCSASSNQKKDTRCLRLSCRPIWIS